MENVYREIGMILAACPLCPLKQYPAGTRAKKTHYNCIFQLKFKTGHSDQCIIPESMGMGQIKPVIKWYSQTFH